MFTDVQQQDLKFCGVKFFFSLFSNIFVNKICPQTEQKKKGNLMRRLW